MSASSERLPTASRRPGPRRAPPRILLLDHCDSFTYNLVHALELAGAQCQVVVDESAALDDLLTRPSDGMVLSAGPCSPQQSRLGVALVRRWCAHRRPQPLLGVCLGHQIIAVALGGTIRRAAEPIHGKQGLVHHDGRGLFAALPNPLRTVRYNSLVVDPSDLPGSLRVSARSANGEIMGVRHRSRPIQGVQFHPESVLSEVGSALFANWIQSVQVAADACAGARARAGYRSP